MSLRECLRGSLLSAVVLLGGGASIAGAAPVLGNFTTGGSGTAGWVSGADAPGDSDGQALKLVVPNAASYAGFAYQNETLSPPSSAPSFQFEPSVSGPSGGSPRLVIAFANGDYVYASPDTWAAGAWSSVGGSKSDWHDAGLAGCAALNDVTYARALACDLASREQLSDAYLVADSSSAAGYTVLVDDISYQGTTITSHSKVLAAQTAKTHVDTSARVSGKTGKGTVSASCGLKSGHCLFSMKLTIHNAGKLATVGTLRGTVTGLAAGNLRILLNAEGRRLLVAAKRLRLVATGKWPGTGQIKQIAVTLTAGG